MKNLSFPQTFPQGFSQVFHRALSDGKSYEEKHEILPDDHGHTAARTLYYRGDHVFLVVNDATLELRCDDKLSRHLIDKYESVMQSRYFGRGGIEIVPAGQLTDEELSDLIRLSYHLTGDIEDDAHGDSHGH